MTIGAIINSVRWALDEEKGYEDYETKYMDRIIRSRVYDALRWINLYADATLLNGGDSSEGTGTSGESSVKDGVDGLTYNVNTGELKMPSNFIRLLRIRCTGTDAWAKAVMSTITEDSDAYMMQNDTNYPEAQATKERPVVALIESKPNKLQIFPAPSAIGNIDITYTISPGSDSEYDPSSESADDSTHVSVPDKAKTAYIYYLAYLVMIAYNETTKAANMLATAKMNAGISDSTKTS